MPEQEEATESMEAQAAMETGAAIESRAAMETGAAIEAQAAMEALAQQVGVALEAADLSAFSDLLDPDVHWGAPDARRPACKNRDQVIAWYQRGRESGTRAHVTEVVVLGDRILVGLTVRGTQEAKERGGAALRWQVLTVRGGRVVDIVGFDDRQDAVARTNVSALEH
jgi:ketosteroid isomerase-like protein